MRIFTCTDHAGFWPVGVASVVLAHDEGEARRLLDAALRGRGLDPGEPYTLQEIDQGDARAVILKDGEY